MANVREPIPEGEAQSALTREVYARLDTMLRQPRSRRNLEQITRLMAKWRAAVLVATQQQRLGPIVQGGPFEGMKYLDLASEGATLARLLGAYEATLHPIIEAIVARDYAQILDVGCAEGYYAVGLARRMPGARVLARDANPAARAKCAELAALNGVTARIDIGGIVTHADFDICAQARTLVICDIEGAEDALLDPARAPALVRADILVEVHDCYDAGMSGRIAQRFGATHNVQTIPRGLAPHLLPPWMDALGDLDRVLALWEWRIGPTPWLWMQTKSADLVSVQKD